MTDWPKIEFAPGDTILCGNPPTGGADHRPIVGEHIATVADDPEGARYLPRQLRATCSCGHSWSVPARSR